jgi:hypothetical protein
VPRGSRGQDSVNNRGAPVATDQLSGLEHRIDEPSTATEDARQISITVTGKPRTR